METINIGLGVSLGIISGVFLGSFALPMKKIKIWNWENTWIMYSFWALVVFPWILAFLTVPSLPSVYLSVSISTIITVFLFGAGWGICV